MPLEKKPPERLEKFIYGLTKPKADSKLNDDATSNTKM